MMILLDIDFTKLPKEQLRQGKNGHIYGRVVCTKMQQPDQYGNEWTLYMQEKKGADKFYIGKGKEYGEAKAEPKAKPAVNDYPEDLGF